MRFMEGLMSSGDWVALISTGMMVIGGAVGIVLRQWYVMRRWEAEQKVETQQWRQQQEKELEAERRRLEVRAQESDSALKQHMHEYMSKTQTIITEQNSQLAQMSQSIATLTSDKAAADRRLQECVEHCNRCDKELDRLLVELAEVKGKDPETLRLGRFRQDHLMSDS